MPDFNLQKPSYTTPWLTPELANSPSLASAAIQSGNPQAASTPLSMAKKGVGTVDAITENAQINNDQSWWNYAITNVLGNQVTQNVFDKLSFLNKPLQEVSDDYKFLHASWVDNPIKGFLATAAAVAGGAGGFLVGGPAGAALGAGAAESIYRHLLGNTAPYANAYAKSNDPNYQISFGRDFSNLLGTAADTVGMDAVGKALKNTQTGWGATVSGAGDFAFDWSADPIMGLTKAATMLKQGKFLVPVKGATSLEMQAKYPLQKTIPGVQQFVMSHTQAAMSPEQLDAVKNANQALNSVSRNYNGALNDMASIAKNAENADQAAGLIAQRYSALGPAAAARIGAMADTAANKTVPQIADDIHNFFRDQLYFGELQGTLNGGSVLPSRSILRQGMTKVADAINQLSPSGENKIYRTFTGYMPQGMNSDLRTLSTQTFDRTDPGVVKAINSFARFALGKSAAQEITGQYAAAWAANDYGLMRGIEKQLTFDVLKASGLPDSNDLVMNAKRALDDTDGFAGDVTHAYGVRPDGSVINDYVAKDGSLQSGALHPGQTSNTFQLPTYDAIRIAMHQSGGLLNSLGRLNDFAVKPLMNTLWKPLALVNAGFGLRVAAAEAMQNISRFGLGDNFQAALGTIAAKSGYKLVQGEGDHVAAALWPSLGLAETRQSLADKMLQAAEAEGKTGDEIAQMAAKLDPSVNPLEDMPAWKQAKAYGLKYASKLVPADYMDAAIRNILKFDGHVTAPVVGAGHIALGSNDLELGRTAKGVYEMSKNAIRYRATGNWTVHAADSNRFDPAYITQLKHWSVQKVGQNVAHDATRLFDGIDSVSLQDQKYQDIRQQLIRLEARRMQATLDGTYSGYAPELKSMTAWQNRDLNDFATDRVDSVLGMVIGRDGTVNKNVLDFLEHGKGVNDGAATEIVRGMTAGQRPHSVAGADLEPYVTPNPAQKVIDFGFRHLVDPIINHISRDPLYTIHTANEMAPYRGLIESGHLNADDVHQLAASRAAKAMLPQIHNPAFRNQFSKWTGTIMPFYFAQEQALRRTFMAMKDTSTFSPVFSRTLRMYEIAYNAIENPAWVTDDGSGNKYLNIPAVGGFGEGVMNALAKLGFTNMMSGLPMTVSGNLASLATVFPEAQLPGMGPIVTVPANIIHDLFPSAPAIIQQLGAGKSADQSILESIIPNSMLKSLWAATQVGNDSEKSTYNMMLSALAAAEYHGLLDNYNNADAGQKQAKIDQIRNNMRIVFGFKALLNMLSPLSPQVQITDRGMRQDFLNRMQANNGDYAKTLMQYLDPKTGYGLSAIGYTTAKTQASTPGANLPLTTQALNWMHANAAITNDPKTDQAAAFLVPQASYDDPAKFSVYNEMLKENLRSVRSPLEFWNQMDVAAGEAVMNPQIDAHKAALEQVKYSSFLTKQEDDRWSQVMQRAATAFPLWHQQYISGSGPEQAQRVLSQFKTIDLRNAWPQDQQSQQVRGLLHDYETHQQNLANATMMSSTVLANVENANWQQYLTGLKQQYPNLVPVINSVFGKLK